MPKTRDRKATADSNRRGTALNCVAHNPTNGADAGQSADNGDDAGAGNASSLRVLVTEVHNEDEELVAECASPELIGTIQGWPTRSSPRPSAGTPTKGATVGQSLMRQSFTRAAGASSRTLRARDGCWRPFSSSRGWNTCASTNV